MPPKQPKKSTSSDDATEEREALALRVIDLLTDQQVLSALKKALFPVELSGRIDALNATLERLSRVVEEKDARITSLEREVRELANANDSLEQYTRRPNLRFEGVPEDDNGEDTDAKVLDIANSLLGMTPPLEIDDLERSHRLGRRLDKDGRPRTRAIIVRFQSERLRDEVFRARTKLKTYNRERQQQHIFINDDLTPRRAKLSFDARALKRSKKIADCWTAYGKVMVKDRYNKVTEVKTPSDLHNMQTHCLLLLRARPIEATQPIDLSMRD